MSVIIQSGYSPTPELTHARIGYESIAYGKTPTASSAASGYPAIAATYPTTYEYWQPTAVPATWAVDNAVPVACDFVGLVGDFNGGTVAVQYSDDGSSWTTQVSGQITGRVTMFLFESVTARYWRIQVTNQIPSVSVVYIGKALAMQRRIYQGHSPLTLSRNTELTNNISEGGQYLGRSIVRQGVATDAAWSHLKADWYRSNFDPFVQSARTLPFFFAWRPSQFPQELGFVWTDGDVQPTNSGPKDYMSVSLNMRGIYNTSRLLLPGSYEFRPSQVLTASRSTTATYIDDDGIMRTAAINEPRWQGGQLLVEGEGTNLLPAPEEFDSVTWVKQATTVTPNLWEPAPNGVQYVADAVFETAATAQHDIYATGASAQGKSFSVFVKPVGRRYIGLYGYAGGIVCGQTFDLVAGVVGSPWTGVAPVATILQPLAGGWWRIGITSAVLMDIGAVIFCDSNVTGIPVYAGNPAAGAYLWGAMMNTGGLGSYTTGTRAADIITVAA